MQRAHQQHQRRTASPAQRQDEPLLHRDTLPDHLTTSTVLGLQRTVGNQAVQRLLAPNTIQREFETWPFTAIGSSELLGMGTEGSSSKIRMVEGDQSAAAALMTKCVDNLKEGVTKSKDDTKTMSHTIKGRGSVSFNMRIVQLSDGRAVVHRTGTTTMPDDPAVEFHKFDAELGDKMFKIHYHAPAPTTVSTPTTQTEEVH